MKNKFMVSIIFLALIFAHLNGNLIELYKKGTIKLEPDPDFGKGVDWDSLFYEDHKDVVVSPDGSIFVFNTLKHNFFKFSPQGQLIGTYGRQGQGPGDINFPSCCSILDVKYLVIGEYASNRRISIFDLSGKYVNIVKTKGSCYNPVALKNNFIAYYSSKTKDIGNPGRGAFNETINIIIKNLTTGKEKVVDSFVLTRRVLRVGSGGYSPGNFMGDAYIHKTGDGNLLVGASNSRSMKIYSPEGKLVKTFRLKIDPIPVTGHYINAVRNYAMKRTQERKMPSQLKELMEKKLKSAEFNQLFGEYLPFYGHIQVDSERNILVFRALDCVENCDVVFQVYSPGGEYVCETRIDEGIYDFEMPFKYQHIQFTNKGIFGIFKLDKEDDDYIRLVKVKVK